MICRIMYDDFLPESCDVNKIYGIGIRDSFVPPGFLVKCCGKIGALAALWPL